MAEGSFDIYPKRQNVRWRWDGEDGTYITYQSPRSGAISILNPVAASIFNYADGSLTVSQIVDKMMEEYEVSNREFLENDVKSFMEELNRAGLILMLEDK